MQRERAQLAGAEQKSAMQTDAVVSSARAACAECAAALQRRWLAQSKRETCLRGQRGTRVAGLRFCFF